jgi:hypothetical protein
VAYLPWPTIRLQIATQDILIRPKVYHVNKIAKNRSDKTGGKIDHS